jgi:hypothetical protein
VVRGPQSKDKLRSARARAERRARGEGTRSHAEARAEWRRDVAEKIAAAGAAAVVEDGAGGVGAEPVAPGFTQRIDALHGETGQILHANSLSGQPALQRTVWGVRKSSPGRARTELLARILAVDECGVKRKDYNGLWWGCGEAVSSE